jgi:carbon-monoxide dehydrogenase medium subunit
MKPAAFAYHVPSSVEEAIALLARLGDAAKIIAGGQSLVPMMNMRIARPEHLVDINSLTQLAFVRDAGDHFAIGALTRHHDVEHSAALQARLPILPRVAQTIAHYAIRTQGTLGGSLAHADPAAQWPLLAVALGASLQVRGPNGERSIGASEFFVSTMSTALTADELIVATHWPVPPSGTGWGFELFARRRGDFALCAVVVQLALKGGAVDAIRVAVGGVTPTPVDASAAAQRFRGRAASDALPAELGKALAASITPDDNAKAAAWYRTELIEALTRRAAMSALHHARGQP